MLLLEKEITCVHTEDNGRQRDKKFPLPPVCTYIDPSLVKNLTYDMVTLCGMMAFNSQK